MNYLLFSLFYLFQVNVIAALPMVEQTAERITVRFEGPRRSLGSGVFVEKVGQTYYILTNAHVVKFPGVYSLYTPDRKCYLIDTKEMKRLTDIDLAIVPLTTPLSYQVAKLGKTDPLTTGHTVYTSGWTFTSPPVRELVFVSTVGEVTATEAKLPQGYALSYTNVVRVGMSGGSVLDRQGFLVGINGMARLVTNSDDIVGSAIPIETFLRRRSGLLDSKTKKSQPKTPTCQ